MSGRDRDQNKKFPEWICLEEKSKLQVYKQNVSVIIYKNMVCEDNCFIKHELGYYA